VSNQWNADTYATHARFVSELGGPVLDLLAPVPGERILDLGCGDGALTQKIAHAGAAVVGVDASDDMVSAARARGIDAQVLDATRLSFRQEFDAVFSNAAMHWMKDQAAVLRGVHRALRPGGRFAGEFGGFGNVAAICTAIRAVLDRRAIDPAPLMPWTFPSAEEFAQLLEESGFSVRVASLIPRPTPLPTDMSGWLRTFAGPFFRDLPDEQEALSETVELLRPSLCDRSGQWTADYVRLRFLAFRIDSL
jgi:trans-aconitate methyltransferase